jgi:hypothetical protein
MSAPNGDQLSDMLKDGWNVAGYSSCIMAAGALVHSLLLQKEAMLTNVTIVTSGDKELGRNMNAFCPNPPAPTEPPKKKGFFG